jgi:hypothetical protein
VLLNGVVRNSFCTLKSVCFQAFGGFGDLPRKSWTKTRWLSARGSLAGEASAHKTVAWLLSLLEFG